MVKQSNINIRFAEISDAEKIAEYDKHISLKELESIIKLKRVYLAERNNKFAGWLRYNLFWDNTPFMNMIYILEEYRGKESGRKLVEVWETGMKKLGYNIVMTSSSSEEYGQHFFINLGYNAVGGFMPDREPYEIIFSKKL